METKDKNQKTKMGGLVFIGCMFIGIGIGMAYSAVNIGTMIGMGVGFVAMGAIKFSSKNSENKS